MSMHLDRANNALFPSDGRPARNIKFFPGRNTAVTSEQRAEQFNRAESQIASGRIAPLVSIDHD